MIFKKKKTVCVVFLNKYNKKDKVLSNNIVNFTLVVIIISYRLKVTLTIYNY